MKKITMLLAACAFALSAAAQTTPASTEVKTRDNGTQKITTRQGDRTTVTKTGKTNVGQALENTADATGNVAKKAGRGIKRGAQKVGRGVKRGAQKVSGGAKRETEKMEAKSENKM